MSVGEYCNRDVVVVERTESVREAISFLKGTDLFLKQFKGSEPEVSPQKSDQKQ